MKSYVRWYDKDKYLSAFMALLQGLDRDVQIEVANDILLNIPKILEKDYDKFINIMSETNPKDYKRWYDFDPILHSAVETMQNLTKEEREELIYSISDIIFRHTNTDFNEMIDKLGILREMKDE